MGRRRRLLTLVGVAAAAAAAIWWGAPRAQNWPQDVRPRPIAANENLAVLGAGSATVFAEHELWVEFQGALAPLRALPADQLHDAYDADRDGVFLRVAAQCEGQGQSFTVPGFALREVPGGPFSWRVRWSPLRAAGWRIRLEVEGRASPGGELLSASLSLPEIEAAPAKTPGPLVAPGPDAPQRRTLRQLSPDGSSRGVWVWGACRAWVVDDRGENYGPWSPHEWLDRDTELLDVMRRGGLDLLNQWQAPWEYMLFHHDRAEHWRVEPDGKSQRHALPAAEAWASHRHYDQGRARDFDRLVRSCAGPEPIRLLLALIPHHALQVRAHPWGENGWSPGDDGGRQPLSHLNGFSGFRPGLSPWDYLSADPALPLDDWRSQLFDHQANLWRYAIARWGASPALGVWVLLDELDGVGDVVGSRAQGTGWWARPACERWLAATVQLFRGELRRSDGLHYLGDPLRHPVHAAATSHAGGLQAGANVDWIGGRAEGQPDLLGWHWYPSYGGTDLPGLLGHVVDGVLRYAPRDDLPRLISEFGAPDRGHPDLPASPLYPSLYHVAIWPAILSGQAGPPLDWDDGKEFGELSWRGRPGAFSQDRYPVDKLARVQALRRFLGDLAPDGTRPIEVAAVGSGARATALIEAGSLPKVHGWAFAPAQFTVSLGLPAGRYRVTWFDPWTGAPVPDLEPKKQQVTVGALRLDASSALSVLRDPRRRKPLPHDGRLIRGLDVAFRVEALPP